MQYTKGFIFLDMKLYLTTLLSVFMLVLGGCSSDESGPEEVSTFSAPLPKEFKVLNLDETNLVVQVIVDGGTPRDCTGLTVDTINGTYSCQISLPAGSHALTLVYSVIDGTYGTVELADTSSVNVDVVAGSTTVADFSTATVTYTDDDSDGITNLDELDEGSDPTATSYYIGGTVSGMVGTGAVLQSDVGDDLPITADGSFNFIPAVADNTSYTVTVLTQPTSPSQTCTVNFGTGTVATANVTNIQVICPCVIGFSEIGNCTLE